MLGLVHATLFLFGEEIVAYPIPFQVSVDSRSIREVDCVFEGVAYFSSSFVDVVR
jgi:hypothetical protein